jgi:hypothetical protein
MPGPRSRVTVKNRQDLLSGLLFMAFGLIFTIGALAYPLGTPARMGAGYFPLALGLVLTAMGAAIALRAFGGPAEIANSMGGVKLRPLAVLLGSILLFGVLLPRIGFIPATFLLIIGVAAAGDEFRWREVLPLAVGVAIVGWLIFVRGLGMIIPAFPF